MINTNTDTRDEVNPVLQLDSSDDHKVELPCKVTYHESFLYFIELLYKNPVVRTPYTLIRHGKLSRSAIS